MLQDTQVGSINKSIEPLSEGTISYETPIWYRRELKLQVMKRARFENGRDIDDQMVRHALMNQTHMSYHDGSGTILGSFTEDGKIVFLRMEFRAQDDCLDLSDINVEGEIPVQADMVETKKFLRQVKRKGKKKQKVAQKDERN